MEHNNKLKDILNQFKKDIISTDLAISEIGKLFAEEKKKTSFIATDKLDPIIIAKAKDLCENKADRYRKLTAVKFLMNNGWKLDEARKYCEKNFHYQVNDFNPSVEE